MDKPLLWLVFSALTAAFFASFALQESRAYYEESRRRNEQPAAYFVEIVEPKLRSAWESKPTSPCATVTISTARTRGASGAVDHTFSLVQSSD